MGLNYISKSVALSMLFDIVDLESAGASITVYPCSILGDMSCLYIDNIEFGSFYLCHFLRYPFAYQEIHPFILSKMD
jgi:hypothetical protein